VQPPPPTRVALRTIHCFLPPSKVLKPCCWSLGISYRLRSSALARCPQR